MIEVTVIRDKLPPGFELLRRAADGEAYEMLTVLDEEWKSGANRFDKPGEALVAAHEGSVLAGMGGINQDIYFAGALRMRRFYVYPPYRRRGVGRAIATFLLERAESRDRLITLNAPRPEAARFWEALGFVRDNDAGHTHIRPANYAHA